MESTQELPSVENATPARRFETLIFGLAGLVVAGVLLQAVLAGQHIAFESPIELHGFVGSAVFALQAAIVILVFMDRASTEVKVTALVIIGLFFAQIGLGYAARSGGHALNAWHIPLGVALFGMSTWQLARIRSASGG
jgi:hypothetical protein